MYDYRKLSRADRKAVLAYRREHRLPLHAPPHYPDGQQTYIITCACYGHQSLIDPARRRSAFQKELLDQLQTQPWASVCAWVILPNHYHLLATLDLALFRKWIRIFHSRLATGWNRENATKGRRVWYRFQDRLMRSEAHYFASINYIHFNPVRHGHSARADEWPWSSLHWYLDNCGREVMVKLWRNYPVDRYGEGWDESPGRHSALLRG
jgi:putative transposase